MIEYCDIVCGLAWGDEAKGKITSQLASSGDYDFVCRWNGGNNAGHTVFVDGNKYKTHLVPSGVFHGIPSIIGPACAVNRKALLDELKYIKENGFDPTLVKVSPRAHMITQAHIDDDKKKLAKKLGTTSKGIAPCYADKTARIGWQAKDLLPSELLWDEELSGRILCEGAQGFWLDLDYGNYPYVTSSTTLPYAACSLGIPPQKIRKIYGAAKIYDTRSGVDPLFPERLLEDNVLKKIGEVGEEYGVTTGRRRKVKWLDLKRLIKSINMSGTTDLIISKVDVLQRVGEFKLSDGHYLGFDSSDDMCSYIHHRLKDECPLIESIRFSSSPQRI